jgi:amidase
MIDSRFLLTIHKVNCLTDWFYEEGLQCAKELDEKLENGGDPIGPLHGIPVALKVQA